MQFGSTNLRRWLASAPLVALGISGIMQRPLSAYSIVTGGFVTACGFLFLRRSTMAQVIARGGAWSVIFPSVLVAILSFSHHFGVGLHQLGPAAMAAFALGASRPLLDDDEARSSFAPLAFRGWFLAAAAAAVGAGFATIQLACAYALLPGVWKSSLLLGLLGATLLASGVGVVRMRGWGIFVGAISAIAAVVTSVSFGWYALTWPLFAASVPGALMVGTLLAARARFAPALDARRDERALVAASV